MAQQKTFWRLLPQRRTPNSPAWNVVATAMRAPGPILCQPGCRQSAFIADLF